jgi:WD40 repeat protein
VKLVPYLTYILRHSLHPDLLVVALSTGCIATYQLNLRDDEVPHLCHLKGFQQFPQMSLVLSLAPNSRSSTMLATLSTGEVSAVDVGTERTSASLSWKAHEMEVWCSAWKTSDVVLTGGDDALLKVWDLRQDQETPQMVSKRSNLSTFLSTDCLVTMPAWFQSFRGQIILFSQVRTTTICDHSIIEI